MKNKSGGLFFTCASFPNRKGLPGPENFIRLPGKVLAWVLAAVLLTGLVLPAGNKVVLERKISSGKPGMFPRIASGICPQKRTTRRAPSRYYNKKNPLAPTRENLKRGERLYHRDAQPTACRLCHGIRGNGNGKLARRLDPPPRNFTCSPVMKDLPDGQLFWIIQKGSRGTAMPVHKPTLREKEIWQLILYIRQFVK
ncbi:MAG: c-type cytochrome [Nitrospinaceae bacterium]